jgi:hypothetical protein
VARRLPYGVQHDEPEAQAALARHATFSRTATRTAVLPVA